MSTDSDAASKEANLLAGDSIINYRTVASFGNEDRVVADYDRLLEGPVSVTQRKSHIIGMTFGFSQFTQYGVYALLYYIAAIFMDQYNEDNPLDIYGQIDYT